MKKLLIAACILNIVSLCADQKITVPEDAVLIDTIKAVVFGQAGTEIVTLSDVVRPSLTGVQQTPDDIIFERLVYLDAQKFKIAPDEEALDKYLVEIQKQNNLTLDELKNIFQQAGYSYEEGREQFKRLQTVKSLLDFKIHSNLIVPKKQVEEYYNAHPEVEEAQYQLAYGVIPFAADKDMQRKKLIAFSKSGVDNPGIEWNEPFWIKQSDVADDKEFIFKMKKGQISQPRETASGFELYHLVDKKEGRVVPLDERYQEIVGILTKPKYDQLMKDYKKQLFDSVSIVYF